MKKSLSCGSLHHSIFAAPDVLRHCCKRFYVNGEMKGDVEICKVTSKEDISYEKIKEEKKKLYDNINSGKVTECTGCPWLTEEEWPDLDQMEIKRISVEHHSVCNLRCSYCSDTYFGGKQASYDIKLLMDGLSDKNAISENVSVVWGGGEPVLLKSFDSTFPYIIDRYKPTHNHVFTNATTYNNILGEYLRKGQVTITTSVDAGTAEMYKKIKGQDKLIAVLENLVKYREDGGDSVTIKYILMPENSIQKELIAFIEEVKKHGLADCSFQISSDYTDENIPDIVFEAAMFLFKGLKNIGAKMINFDYHLRPRIDKYQEEERYGLEEMRNGYDNVIVWGAGEYATRMLENKFFSGQISFFVDSDPGKQGKKLNGVLVKSPDAIREEKEALIFIASIEFYRDIYKEILNMGISADQVLDANAF